MPERRLEDSNITSMKTTLDFMAPQLQAVHDTIHGNGKDGMKTTMGKHGVYIKVLCVGFLLIIGWIVKGLIL